MALGPRGFAKVCGLRPADASRPNLVPTLGIAARFLLLRLRKGSPSRNYYKADVAARPQTRAIQRLPSGSQGNL